LESHALHGDGIYYEFGDRFWVNLYVPSAADWPEQGARWILETDLPEGERVTLRLALGAPRSFTLLLRRPAWAGEGFRVDVNGERITTPPPPGNYVELRRTWQDSDAVELRLPKALRGEALVDNRRRVAFLWGPLVLAGDLGPEEGFEVWQPGAVPVLVTADRPAAEWLKPIPGRPGGFRTEGVGRDREVEFVPFYRLQRRTYAIYFDLLSPGEWDRHAADQAAQRERERQLALSTVAFVQPGEMQPERDFHQRGEDSWPDRVLGRPGRRGKGWFSFDVPVEAGRSLALVATYYSDEWRKRTFEIQVEGQHLAAQTVERGGTPRFFDVEYPLPSGWLAGKQRITVRFEATQGNEIACLFGLRVIRAAAQTPSP
jgi:hypothetical protein